MRKLLMLCFLIFPAFAYEEVPLLIDTGTINVEIKEDDNKLIDTKNLKKINDNQKIPTNSKLKLDTRKIHHQRTLDYMNNKNGTMLPIF